MSAFTLAHLSDPHLPLPVPRLSELIGKRMTGYINWRRKRGRLHQRAVLDALTADLAAHTPDHIALTGDLANIGLAAEYAPARAWLETLGTRERVTVVPGNHDVYVRATQTLYAQHWAPYLLGDDSHDAGAISFPFVRRRGPVALIGLCSAVPTLPFFATGRLGAAQLARLDALLAAPEMQNLCRVVLIHHPLAVEQGEGYKCLIDADGLRAVLTRHGAELVLHGHMHREETLWIEGPRRNIPVIGIPSASAIEDGTQDAAAYNLLRIARLRGEWIVEMTVRGWTGSGVEERRRLRLISPGAD